jgi:hypothetical protein
MDRCQVVGVVTVQETTVVNVEGFSFAIVQPDPVPPFCISGALIQVTLKQFSAFEVGRSIIAI